jgi:hypothetical protein
MQRLFHRDFRRHWWLVWIDDDFHLQLLLIDTTALVTGNEIVLRVDVGK